MAFIPKNNNLKPDNLFVTIADYLSYKTIDNELAYKNARLCLMDSLGCAIQALQYPACTKLLGPIIPGTTVPLGVRVPGTIYELDPILAAFNIGTQIRWLDFNDTWLAAEWGHPSDNLGAILSVSDYQSRKNLSDNIAPYTISDVLTAIIKAHEIQGILALQNSFNQVGLDHVILVKVASAAVAMSLLGGTHDDIINVLSQVFVDGQSLRTYRHAPNTGPRKSWAAGDATSRGLHLAWLVKLGETGYPTALTAKTWGFNDVLFRGKDLKLSQPLNSYVIENILFKVRFPAEFHAQTAIECAIALHHTIKDRIDNIDKIILTTHEAAVRIINKTGPLRNPADRDHCLQYMVAVALLYGELNATFYEEEASKDPKIDFLREKMIVQEDPTYSQDYLDPKKRSIANAIQIYFKDGTKTEIKELHYPIGHPRRRDEAEPLLFEKFKNNLSHTFSEAHRQKIIQLFLDPRTLDVMSVNEFMDLFRPS